MEKKKFIKRKWVEKKGLLEITGASLLISCGYVSTNLHMVLSLSAEVCDSIKRKEIVAMRITLNEAAELHDFTLL